MPEPVPKAKEEESGNESEVAEDTEPVVQANRDTSRAIPTVERVQSMDVDNTVEEGEEVEENEAVSEVLLVTPMAMNEDQDNSVAEAEVQPEIADIVENTTESAEGIDILVEMDVAESDIPSKE